jgi:hypothetical protein
LNSEFVFRGLSFSPGAEPATKNFEKALLMFLLVIVGIRPQDLGWLPSIIPVSNVFSFVPEPDDTSHRPMLYQLSYAHRRGMPVVYTI